MPTEDGGRLKINFPALHPIQQKIYEQKRRFTILRIGRQAGKSFFASIDAIIEAQKPNQVIIVIAPTFRQTQAIYKRIRVLLKPLFGQDMGDGTPFVREYKSELYFEFYNGSTIMAASADNPDKLRGYTIDYILFDEAASMEKGPELWFEVVRPALAVSHGKAMFLSTPKGKDNWFYDLWKYAEADIKEWGDKSDWAIFHHKSTDSPYFPQSEADAILAIGDNYYMQEVEAEFTAHANTLITVDNFHFYNTTIQDGDLYFLHATEMTPEKATYRVMTVDLAVSDKTSADYTAYAIGDLTRRGLCFVRDVYRERILGPDAADKIVAYAKRHNVQAIHVESVAYQLTVVQELERRGVTVKKLVAKGDKTARLSVAGIRMNAQQMLYQREAPWLNSVIDEVTSFPDGRYDDRADALGYLAHVSAEYAMQSGVTVFGQVTLEQVAKSTIDEPDLPRVDRYDNVRVKNMVKKREESQSRGGMSLEKMRGPM